MIIANMQHILYALPLILMSLFSPQPGWAQGNFMEGEIIYTVKIERNNPNTPHQQASEGLLTIRLKNGALVKELKLHSGQENTLIFEGNDKVAYALRNIGKEHYALQLDAEQLRAGKDKCARMTAEELPCDIKTIAHFKTEKARIHCNNATPVVVYYTREWQISHPHLFEAFPSFGYLPLSYDIRNEDGSVFHFELRSIEARPMDNTAFKVPEGYKIISQEEYRSWRH